jgi:ECF sigma factor
MSDVTRILSQIEAGDPQAAEMLLPLVYDELRKLAASKMAQEKSGQMLQATALVHEEFLKLVFVWHRIEQRRQYLAGAYNSAPHRRPRWWRAFRRSTGGPVR